MRPIDHRFWTSEPLVTRLCAEGKLKITTITPGLAICRKDEKPLTQPSDVQQYLAYLADSMRGCGPEQLAALEPSRRNLVLAARFDYDVRKGGFAQFLYNMHGQLLREVGDMLIGANAVVAHEAYVQAVETCLADRAGISAVSCFRVYRGE